MEQQSHIVIGIRLYGRNRRVVSLLSALQHMSHLAVSLSPHHVPYLLDIVLPCHYSYLVYASVLAESLYRVLYDSLPCHLDKLFWLVASHSSAGASGEYDCYVHPSFPSFYYVDAVLLALSLLVFRRFVCSCRYGYYSPEIQEIKLLHVYFSYKSMIFI